MKPGEVRPLAISGIGRTLLSGHTDVEIARLMRRINAACPPEERIDLNALMKIINGIRRDGYMFSRHIVVQDAGVIAILLPKRDFGRDLVLGVGGPVSRLEERQEEILACIRKGIAQFLT